MNRIKEVEKRIQKRFPKCQPMFGEMVEFIAQSTSDQLLQPNFHPKNLLANEYATALPFAHFSNLIYSKELLIQFASRQFKCASTKANSKRKADPIQLWGMPLPSTDNFSYQFWVVHLKGKNGDAYKSANNINEKGKFIKV